MIYRMEILTETTTFEGWAQTIEEMRSKFADDYPGVDCEVFLSGGSPQYLTLSEYREVKVILGNDELVHIFDKKLGSLLLARLGN